MPKITFLQILQQWCKLRGGSQEHFPQKNSPNYGLRPCIIHWNVAHKGGSPTATNKEEAPQTYDKFMAIQNAENKISFSGFFSFKYKWTDPRTDWGVKIKPYSFMVFEVGEVPYNNTTDVGFNTPALKVHASV